MWLWVPEFENLEPNERAKSEMNMCKRILTAMTQKARGFGSAEKQ